ncbi:HAD family hydrolase [Gordonia paraffinivorans]|uniref:HAD family hydrolase n=1 Tax=Gordonia paraffinivorans TaxID=175628 RepID=UPI001C92CAE2|nr:HAD-IB family phosphatase [Gordonia paraffinivorans]MBY4574892.1 HAD family hydrolase [Gordonia paraffinivorans]
MSVLHVFDMDGTLLRGTSASIELARHIRVSEQLDVLEKLSAAGELSNVEFHRRTHPLWQSLTDADVDTVFSAAPWIGHLRTVFDDIASRGEIAIVVSMSPLFFVERLIGWGARAVFASHNPIGGPFDESLILEDGDKVAIVQRYAHETGIDSGRVVAYGDSYTDIPLFRSGVASVAVNGSDAVEALAVHRYRGDDLRKAYALGRSLLV